MFSCDSAALFVFRTRASNKTITINDNDKYENVREYYATHTKHINTVTFFYYSACLAIGKPGK
ncbi:hypothetical protein GCM10009111_08420 [Colwellia asteriadis]|uniref:Uncharacterized protein n=1 Tax=Colwellia asteriadis TaxID=517723 RepID=A0ABN1L4B9_9GAMM